MKRLHLQIFLTLAGVVVFFALLVSLSWWILDDDDHEHHAYFALQAVIEAALPADQSSRDEVEAVLRRVGERAEARITLRSETGELLGAYGDPLPDILEKDHRHGWQFGRDKTVGLLLSDGRRVTARPDGKLDDHPRGLGFFFALLAFVIALGIGAYPLSRGLTGRLERLKSHADRLGAGDLSARAEVEGRDEVAALARSFNRAADQIEKLVESQKQTLAAASHELRSPLARLRMAFELLERSDVDGKESATALRARVERDIGELDSLIEELLLASRLDAAPDQLTREAIDLLGLAAEAAAPYDAEVIGQPLVIHGDERLLRRLLRNLLENAQRHGQGQPAKIEIRSEQDRVLLRVSNKGPKIPEAEREKIFQPFYRPPGQAEEGKGYGLGLFLVQQIASRHGGKALCREQDGGPLFEVIFPNDNNTNA